MAKRPDFDPVETSKGWMISIPAAMSGTGKRVRKYFRDERLARKFGGAARAAHNSGSRGSLISADLARDAVAAAAILDPLGISLSDAARLAVAAAGPDANPETFGDRYDRALLANEGRWRDRYMTDMEKIPRWVGRSLMAEKCSAITREIINDALAKHGASAQSTLDARGARVRAILGHRDRHHKSATIRILTPAECEAMLAACATPDERRALALLLWAGIRPDAEGGEIARLDWEDVGTGEIYVPQDVAKTGTDRHIPITARLKRELKGHPKSGCVSPAGWKRAYQRIRKAAGVAGQDVTRHTFASNYLAAHGEDKAKAAMGHTAGSSTIFRHYRRAVTESAGKAFFR